MPSIRIRIRAYSLLSGSEFQRRTVRGFCLGGKDVQKKLLEADGIEVVNGTVDLKKYGLTQRDDKL